MAYQEKHGFKETIKLENARTKCKRKCDCGHTILFTGKVERVICNWCGNYAYKDGQTKFRYEMNRRLK